MVVELVLRQPLKEEVHCMVVEAEEPEEITDLESQYNQKQEERRVLTFQVEEERRDYHKHRQLWELQELMVHQNYQVSEVVVEVQQMLQELQVRLVVQEVPVVEEEVAVEPEFLPVEKEVMVEEEKLGYILGKLN